MIAERINKGGFMSKHTPGPWVMLQEECDKPYIRIRGSQIGDRYKIANVITPIYENVHEREAKETRANAALIAAAPELLNALVLMTETFLDDGKSEQLAMDAARAAISKATGGK